MTNLQMLRTSERGQFKRCPWAWDKSYRQGLRLKQEQVGPLWLGTGIHLALAEWYIPGRKRGRHPLETWEEYCDNEYTKLKADIDGEEAWVDSKALGIEMLTNYLKKWGEDEEWEIIAPEQRFSVNVEHPNRKGTAIRNFVGTFDGVYRNLATGKLHLMDHKTAAQIKTAHLFNDEQAGGYVTVAEYSLKKQGLIKPKEEIWGITFNFLRKGFSTDDRPKNPDGLFTNKPTKSHYIAQLSEAFGPEDEESGMAWDKLSLKALEEAANAEGMVVYGEVSKNQGTPLFHREEVRRTRTEKRRMLQRIGEEAVMMDAVDSGLLPLLKTPADHCSWCQFKDLCSLDEQGGDVDEFRKFTYNVTDPYSDHREGATNSKTSLADNKAGAK